MISVILPLSQNESKEKIKDCLHSLASQTYRNFEAIIVASPQTAKAFSPLFKEYPFIKILTGSWNKSAARNMGVKKSRGKYLLHLDADMTFSPTLLAAFIQKAQEGERAIIASVKGKEETNFWGKCRALEKKLHLNDFILETPEFIEKSLFKKIGGFDENLDPLDDWGLHLSLKAKGVKFSHINEKITVYEAPTLKETVKRMYERGQALAALQNKHPNLPQIKISSKIKTWQENRRTALVSPFLFSGLMFLKIIDLFAFQWGRLHPRHPYIFPKTAAAYDKNRLGSNFNRYKHFAECQALFTLLKQSPAKILEIGCGTGRITAELIKKGFQVAPTDPSEAMLEQFKKKPGLPKPIKAGGANLPFKAGQFPIALAIRVIWHQRPKESQEILSQMKRASSQFLILDIANKKRFLAKFLIGSNTYPVSLKEFLAFCRKKGLKLKKIIPLDVSLPIWLNFLPRRLAEKCFSCLYRLDLKLAKIIAPGRYLLKLSKTP